MDIKLTKKQLYAFQALEAKEYDPELGYEANIIEELVFGGAAGGGKSDFGCAWILLNCVRYPGSRWFMGRTVLKRLRQSTLLTFWKVCSRYGFRKDIDFHYNSIDGILTFVNGSEIYLLDLFHYPADPEYDRFGSMEFTGGFIDETQEVPFEAYDVLTTRLRYKTRDFGIRGQLLMTCNPGKNFLYRTFYKPYIAGTLAKHRAFIQSLVQDNPFIDPGYIQKLKRASEAMRKKLLEGNWDYADASDQLVPYSWLDPIFVDERPAMTANSIRLVGFDIAREGEDNSVISLFIDNTLTELFALDVPINRQTDIGGLMASKLIRYCQLNGVGYKNTTIDAIGVGVSVADACRRAGFFVNEYKGGSPVKKDRKLKIEKFKNLRTYSHWIFREMVQRQELKIYKGIKELDNLIADITAYTFSDNDKLIILEEKDSIKKKIGRSPDFLDSVTMAIAPQPKTAFTLVKNY
jgi:phage terminase large subunit